jgi:5-(carboxyamino)imidazole ribonucleotide synthase
MQSDKWFASNGKLGILGGGQLGKMLLEEAIRLDIVAAVMDSSETCACSSITPLFEKGDLMSESDVLAFGRKVEVLTIEIEHVHVGALKTLEEEGVRVYPPTEVIERIQDKGVQKDFYRQLNLPTAKYELFATKTEIEEALIDSDTWIFPIVWKACKGGYDGRGVKMLKSIHDLQDLPDVPSYLEEKISLKTEIACVGIRSASGEKATYPPVGMSFHPEANQVEEVFVPSDSAQDLLDQARQYTELLLEEQKHVGLLAVEFLVNENGELLVNEMAPRPHNSGHIFSDTSWTSQFEQHLRAIMDLPLGSTELHRSGVMINLVGEEGHQGPVLYEGAANAMSHKGVYLHLYGKNDTRPFRKMGHINVVAEELEDARILAQKLRKELKIISR